MQKGAELGQSLFGALAKHQQNILPNIDNQQFTQLLKEGKTEQALNVLCQENKVLASIREKVLHNLANPVSFFGRTARGIIDTGFTLEQAAADVALHNFRSKDEQLAVIDSWTKSYKTFVGNINNASADKVNDLVSSFIADSVTFGIAHKSYQATGGIRAKLGQTLQTQKPFPKKLNETSSMQIRNQLPATIRSNQKPQAITPTKIAANTVTKKNSQAKSTKTSSSTNAQIQKTAQNKTTVAEQKGFKPAIEESAKKTATLDAVKKFEQKYQHYRQRFGAIAETGEKVRIPFPKSDIKKIEWAEDAYEAIRAQSGDVAKIAHNTLMPESKIQRIKDHLFYDESHVLSLEERVGSFSPHHEIAAAWDRLTIGDYIENDIKLLEHEYFESRFEKMFKTDYDTAHKKTQDFNRGRPWFDPNYKE